MARFLKNRQQVSFPDPQAAGTAPTHIQLYDAATGGNLLISRQVASAVSAPGNGDPVVIPAEGFTVTIGMGDGTDAALEDLLGGLASQTLYFAMADGAASGDEFQTSDYPRYARASIASGVGSTSGWVIEPS